MAFRTTSSRVTIAIAATALTVMARAAQDPTPPDLTGTWTLNKDLTDHARQAEAPEAAPGEGRTRRPPGGGGMGGRGGGFGGRGGAEGGMPNRDDIERMRAAMDAAMRTPTRLIIVKAETGLIVTDEEGVSTRLPLDGKKDTGAVNGVPFETTTKWTDGKLRVERKFKGGVTLVEHYLVSSNPRLLTVASKIEGGRMRSGGRTVTRVYENRESAGSESR